MKKGAAEHRFNHHRTGIARRERTRRFGPGCGNGWAGSAQKDPGQGNQDLPMNHLSLWAPFLRATALASPTKKDYLSAGVLPAGR